MDDPENHSKKKAAISVARINSNQTIICTVITASFGILGVVIQGYFNSRQVTKLKSDLHDSTGTIERMEEKLKGSAISVAERKALYRLTADVIESDLKLTSGKRDAVSPSVISDEDLEFKRIRRAVFVHMGELRADVKILQNTLDEVSNRGHGWIAPHLPKILADFPTIKKEKLRWIEDHAIPALQKAIDEERDRPMAQDVPRATVKLPREIWIIQDNPGEQPTMTVTDMTALKSEADLIKQSL